MVADDSVPTLEVQSLTDHPIRPNRGSRNRASVVVSGDVDELRATSFFEGPVRDQSNWAGRNDGLGGDSGATNSSVPSGVRQASGRKIEVSSRTAECVA